jgi:hypothetical protein
VQARTAKEQAVEGQIQFARRMSTWREQNHLQRHKEAQELLSAFPPTANHEPRTAVLVRSHRPTRKTLARLAQWAHELTAQNIALHCSFDISAGREHYESAASILEAHGIQIHAYTEAEMKSRYTILTQMHRKLPPDWNCWAANTRVDGTTGRAAALGSLAWGFHTEAIGLWWQSVRAPASAANADDMPIPAAKRARREITAADAAVARHAPRYDHVWILEDDVGVIGKLSDVIGAYQMQPSDLITHHMTRTERWEPALSRGWCWHDAVSDLYASLVPEDKQVRGPRAHAALPTNKQTANKQRNKQTNEQTNK